MKLLKKKNGKKLTNVELGKLYEINKSIIEKNVPPLTQEEVKEKIKLIDTFIKETNNKYYMFLCNDRKDYTVFNLNQNGDTLNAATILTKECCINRGVLKSIDLSTAKDAIEIWLSIEKESYCYYFFPYDLGIIEC